MERGSDNFLTYFDAEKDFPKKGKKCKVNDIK